MTKQYIWNFLIQKGLTEAGAAGLMGNLRAESGFQSNNLENYYNNKFGLTDEEYTEQVDNGTYKSFVTDHAGYGLAQWTYWSRKQNLIDYATETGRSIADLTMQLEYLYLELEVYFPDVLAVLKTSDSVKECSDKVLVDFENPANMAYDERYEYSMEVYNEFHVEPKDEYTNSPLVDYVKLSPHVSPREAEIDTVTIHCTVGQGTVETIGDIFANPDRGASSNYGIGFDGRIGMYAEESTRAWTTGGKDLDGQEIFVNGISGSMNDHRAITIEVSSNHVFPYTITVRARDALIKLLVDICERHPKIGRLRWQADKNLVGNIELQNVTAHRWFALTDCPGDFIYNDLSRICAEVNAILDKKQFIDEEDDMTVDRFTELYNEMRKQLQDNDSQLYSAEARAWALSTGLVNGNGTTIDGEPNCMWEDVLTREQFVTVLYRFFNMLEAKK